MEEASWRAAMADLVDRRVSFPGGTSVTVDLNRPVARYPGNPILTPEAVNARWTDPESRVVTVHNAGAARAGDETVLLFRSHLRSGISVIGCARSVDGITGWRIEPRPVLSPATEEDDFAPGTDPAAMVENESGGVEDPRVTCMGGLFAVTYSAYHGRMKNRVRTSLAVTRDFRRFTRYGPLLDRDMRNVVLFPEPFGERFVALFRPNDRTEGDVGGRFTEIRIGWTPDWRNGPWALSEAPVMKTGGGPGAFSDKIGPGAPPMRTPHGWLHLFHGVRTTMDGNPYVLGAALHDPKDPAEVTASRIPILFPSRADCRVAEDAYVHVPNVVFTCGALRRQDGSILIYYGGCDTVMNAAISHEDVLAALCMRYPLAGS